MHTNFTELQLSKYTCWIDTDVMERYAVAHCAALIAWLSYTFLYKYSYVARLC